MQGGTVKDKLITNTPNVRILANNKAKYLNGTPPRYNSIRPAKNIIAEVDKFAGKIIAQINTNGANNFQETFSNH